MRPCLIIIWQAAKTTTKFLAGWTLRDGWRRESGKKSAAEWHGLPPSCMAGSSITAFCALIGRLFSICADPCRAGDDHWWHG